MKQNNVREKTQSFNKKRLLIGLSATFLMWLAFSLCYVYALENLVASDPYDMPPDNAITDQLGYPPQREIGYANGLYWVFYSNIASMGYSTSYDNYTSFNAIRGCNRGRHFSVCFDGTTIHYVYGYHAGLFYRKGTLESNGTISWIASEQSVATSYNDVEQPTISVDANDYVWIGYLDEIGSLQYPYVIKSGSNDGTWGVTPAGFPYRLKTLDLGDWVISIECVGTDTVAFYSGNGFPLYAKVYNGTHWGTEDDTGGNTVHGSGFSTNTNSTTPFIYYTQASVYYLRYWEFDMTSETFVNLQTIIAGTSVSTYVSTSYDPVTDNRYLFHTEYAVADHAYYSVMYSNGSLESSTDFVTDTGLQGQFLASFKTAMGTENEALGFAYVDYDGGLGKVNFVTLNFTSRAPPPEEEESDISIAINFMLSYLMPFLGLLGLVMLTLSPIVFYKKYKAKKYDDAVAYAFLLFIFGLGLFVAWIGGYV